MNCLQCNTLVESKIKKFCNNSCSAKYNNSRRKHSAETKAKISKSAKANPSGYHTRDPILKNEYIQKRIKHYEQLRLPRMVENICKECNKSFTSHELLNRIYCSQKCSSLNKYHPNSTRLKKSVYCGYNMDSGAELKFAMLMEANNIKWIKNTTTSFPYTFQGNQHRYYPDFYLPEYDHWVEIKGRPYYNADKVSEQLKAVGNIELMFAGDIAIPHIVGGSCGN